MTLTEAAHVAMARAVVPAVARNSDRTERERRLASASFAALRDAELFKLGTPRRLGGHAASVRTATEVCIELARGCASSSWLVGIAYGGNLFAAQLEQDTRELIWADNPDVIVCGAANPSGTVRRVSGGVVLSGRWPYVSGILHAQWVALGVEQRDEQDPVERALVFVPRDQVDVADTWHVAGMRGTGSNTAVVDGVFVPDERMLTFEEMASGVPVRRHPDELRVTFPLPINLPLVGTGIGVAQAALEYAVLTVSGGKRNPSPLHGLVSEAPAHQLNVADAATLIDTARLHLFRAADELDFAARAGRRPDLESRSRLRMDASHAMRCARDAVSLLVNVNGAGSFADDSPLQRAWRDVEMASRHAALSIETAREIYGRVLLGARMPVNPAI